MTKKLTPAIIAGMEAGTKLSDPDTKGLLVVAGLKDKTFIYRYRAGEKIKQVKIGHFGPMTLKEAQKKAEVLRGQHLEGGDPAEEKKAAKALPVVVEGYTVSQMIDDYLTGHVDRLRKSKGASEVRRFLESDDLQAIRKRQAVEVTRKEAFALIGKIAARAPVIAGNMKTELKAAYEFALNAGVIDLSGNPFGFRLAGLVPKKRDRILTDAELATLIPWFKNYSETVRDALTITLLCGVRSGEVCGMHSSEIEETPEGMVWTIPASKSKNGQAFEVMAPRQAAEIIRRRLETRATWVFPSRDPKKPIDQKVLGVETWKYSPDCPNSRYEGIRTCPVGDWVPHDLRRTARTGLAKLGCPHEVAEACLNHTLAGVAGVYNRHQFSAEKRHWLQAWADHIANVSGGKA